MARIAEGTAAADATSAEAVATAVAVATAAAAAAAVVIGDAVDDGDVAADAAAVDARKAAAIFRPRNTLHLRDPKANSARTILAALSRADRSLAVLSHATIVARKARATELRRRRRLLPLPMRNRLYCPANRWPNIAASPRPPLR